MSSVNQVGPLTISAVVQGGIFAVPWLCTPYMHAVEAASDARTYAVHSIMIPSTPTFEP